MKFTCAILVVNNACFNKTAIDEAGPALAESIKANFPEATGPVSCTVVPNDQDQIIESLECLCKHNINLILTTGATNLEVPRTTTLSRAIVDIKDNSLIINLPENLNEALESFRFIKSVIPNLIELILNGKDVDSAHLENQQVDEQAVKCSEEVVDLKRKSVDKDEVEIDEGNNEISNFTFMPAPMRRRTSHFEVVNFNAAFKIVCDSSNYPRDVEEIAIEDSLNRVLAFDEALNVPSPFKVSERNGYAVISADGDGERVLKIINCATFDYQSDIVVQSGEAVRISTGGCVPKGADAVVPFEDTDIIKCARNEIKIRAKEIPKINQYIKIDSIKSIFDRETITSTHIGVFVALGHLKVNVYKRARVGILSTGDALYSENSTNFNTDHIINSNNLVLLNLLKCFGYAASDLGIVKHHPDLLKQALYKAFTNHDVVITTGGVSVAEYEVIKEVLELDFGASIQFGLVNMEPGYSTSFATCIFNGSRKFVFSLPGDIASVMIACRVLVIPALRVYENSKDNTYHTFAVKYNHYTAIKTGERRIFRRISLRKGADNSSYDCSDDINTSFSSCTAALIIIPENTNTILYRRRANNEDVNFNVVMLYS